MRGILCERPTNVQQTLTETPDPVPVPTLRERVQNTPQRRQRIERFPTYAVDSENDRTGFDVLLQTSFTVWAAGESKAAFSLPDRVEPSVATSHPPGLLWPGSKTTTSAAARDMSFIPTRALGKRADAKDARFRTRSALLSCPPRRMWPSNGGWSIHVDQLCDALPTTPCRKRPQRKRKLFQVGGGTSCRHHTPVFFLSLPWETYRLTRVLRASVAS